MQGAQTEEIGARVRQRLIEIVQESGVVVEEAENIVRRASRPDLAAAAADGGATCAKPNATGGDTCVDTAGNLAEPAKVNEALKNLVESLRSGDVLETKPAAVGDALNDGASDRV